MRMQGGALVSAISPHGIIDLEFAWSPARVTALKAAWDPGSIYLNTALDFLYILSYTSFLVAACRWVTAKAGWERAGGIGASATLVAGCADALENALMMTALHNPSGSAITAAGILASVKFALLAVVAAFLWVAFFASLKRKGRRRKQTGSESVYF
ncbi:MAG: hypothetical protein JWP27_2118 [Flaviaesturariibacter sp.]|nr:hypothetical protein [Flaviaesturariibacter sp.]